MRSAQTIEQRLLKEKLSLTRRTRFHDRYQHLNTTSLAAGLTIVHEQKPQ
jgi:hypothetical protein